MQQFQAIGNLTRDPEIFEARNGKSVCRFTIAVNKEFYNQNGDKEADFFNCSAFEKQADSIAKYCHKGDKVYVRGTIQLRSYEDNQGITRTAVDVPVKECEFVYLRNNSNENR